MNSKWIAAVALGAALVIQGCAGASGTNGANGRDGADLTRAPRHVILVIGDGMQRAHEVAASRYLTGRDAGLVFHDPLRFDWSGFGTTWDVTTYNRYAQAAARPPFADHTFDPALGYDVALGGATPYPLQATPSDAYFLTTLALGGAGAKEPATDSASAGTALATGFKTDDGNIAWRPGDPAGGRLTTIAEALRARFGGAIGVVSTVPFTHATPACFVSHNMSRGNYHAIGGEIIRTVTPDVVIGGGWPFDPDHANTSYRFIARAEYDALSAGSTAYTFVERIPGRAGGARLLAAAASLPAGGKLFGLFGAQSGAVDGSFEPPVPTADPTTLVTAGTLARENPTLAEATEAALTVLSRNPSGFFAMIEQGDIDWANHAGNMEWLFGAVWDLDQAVSAAIGFVDRPGDDLTWENTLLIVTADHGNNYLRLGGTSLGKGQLPAMDAQKRPTDAAQFTMSPLNGASSWNHTNELVSVYAKGATSRELFRSRTGTWYPGAHIVDNTQIHDVMAEFLGLR